MTPEEEAKFAPQLKRLSVLRKFEACQQIPAFMAAVIERPEGMLISRTDYLSRAYGTGRGMPRSRLKKQVKRANREIRRRPACLWGRQ